MPTESRCYYGQAMKRKSRAGCMDSEENMSSLSLFREIRNLLFELWYETTSCKNYRVPFHPVLFRTLYPTLLPLRKQLNYPLLEHENGDSTWNLESSDNFVWNYLKLSKNAVTDVPADDHTDTFIVVSKNIVIIRWQGIWKEKLHK